VALATMEQLRAPQPQQPDPKGPQAVEVPRYCMVVEVALHDRPEPLARFRHGIMPAPPELPLDFLQLRPQALADRLALHGEVPVPVFPTQVRESQKVERLGLAFPSAFPVPLGIPPELDPARFLRVQFQSKLPQPFPEILPKTVSFRRVLEPQDRIIGLAHDDHVSSCVFLAPRVHPEVEDVVQIDIRQQR